ncbi:MAG TPA: hypothetical protein VL860_07000 [Planctomycetota bacterium]|nr:hypothetical protein [Planctomycetota bacterium]
MQSVYENPWIGVRFTPDPDMKLQYFPTITHWSDPQFDNYQRRFNDLPMGDTTYLVLFSAFKHESDLVIKEVTCRIERSLQPDLATASQPTPPPSPAPEIITIGPWRCTVSRSPLRGRLQFHSEVRKGFRLTGEIRGPSVAELDRMLANHTGIPAIGQRKKRTVPDYGEE